MLRFEISEHGRGALPSVDLADDVVVIGSAPSARVRLPAEVARPEHVRIDRAAWTLLAESTVGGMLHAAGASGSVGHGTISVVLRFRDPAERHLRGEPPLAQPLPRSPPAASQAVAAPRPWPIFAFAAIAVLALAALTWILAS